jgi:hypothetical protein
MRTFTRRATLALVVAITFTSMAAGCTPMRGPDASVVPPTSSAGQGGGGTGSGGGTVQQAAGALYGDLYVIERDGNGVPVLKEKTIKGVDYSCQQPIAANCTFLALNLDKSDFNPELEDACAVRADDQVNDTAYLQAVSFGRESVARAPSTVLDKSYGEAIKSINAAVKGSLRTVGNVDLCTDVHNAKDQRAIKLDPAGRITLCLPSETLPVTYAWKTIDAPLENLGLYRELMTSGCFNLVKDKSRGEEGTIIDVYYVLSATAKVNLTNSGLRHLVCAGDPPVPQTEPTPHEIVTKADMLSAAVFLAAGADKTSPVTLDEVINLNNYVGVNTWTYTTSKKVKTLTIDYFQFKVPEDGVGQDNWFGYTKGVDACVQGNDDNEVAVLAVASPTTFVRKDVEVFSDQTDGVDLKNVAVTVCRNSSPLVQGQANVVCDAAADNPVYVTGDTGGNIYGCGGANWFTQAAEHARKTIWYLHNYELPETTH